MEEAKNYDEYLGDSTFVKWGCIISKLIWKKSHREIGEALHVSKPYISKVVNKFLEGKKNCLMVV